MEICFEILSANKRYQSTDTSRPLLVSPPPPPGGRCDRSNVLEETKAIQTDEDSARFGPSRFTATLPPPEVRGSLRNFVLRHSEADLETPSKSRCVYNHAIDRFEIETE